MKELADADMGKTKLPSKPIIITFDDGYYSNYEYIYPILKKYHIKASIFIVTDKIGQEIDGIKYLGWTQETVRALKNNGIDFQLYDIGINNFKKLDRDFMKRINIPCEMTGQEIIEEIH